MSKLSCTNERALNLLTNDAVTLFLVGLPVRDINVTKRVEHLPVHFDLKMQRQLEIYKLNLEARKVRVSRI